MAAMLTLEQAQAEILGAIRRADARETVTLDRASGRYLAEAARARVDHPAFDNSAMDGYALRAADLAGAGFVLPVRGASSCGDAPGRLDPGAAMRIFTGAPLPEGADTIVIQENAVREGDRVRVPETTKSLQHLRRAGEDFRAGETLYEPGRRLMPADLSVLATAGVDRVQVCAPARALVISTGNELTEPGAALAPGRIYESNRLATLVQLRALGVDAVDGGIARDDARSLRDALIAAGEYDFVVTSGGASVGEHDIVRDVIGELGEIRLWKVRVKPGKPVAFGRIGSRAHFFALPGNPVSSLVTFKLFVEPAVRVWHHGTAACVELTARAAAAYRRRPDRTEFLRARLYVENGVLHAEALKGQGSHMIGALRHTNGLIRIEAESEGFAAGESLRVLPLTLEGWGRAIV
ncbi:molybdopterin biosynthesis protein MoeA [Sulfurifustis variabilis]|uniref:Molybdopterin molybdenumtransferase n=1 Tax=Sulfurifustis variabilis TaxID=1675686 RepID=A0A1B4V042_9GAMM|nr:gephyrin-like molybdotransferase Glp [Sulfurifustis variabilis]BAU46806.1 molybdopterin biosynthesis protein MoeA [Sulfurifustis variabilis]